jgi:phenylpropionate dioxygenase-like ring-hydroxylating dioxygenase large terminal subunit
MFLAHKNDHKGMHFPLEQLDKTKVLVNVEQPFMVSNICPHQNSIISTVPGQGNRVCPYHNWSFTQEGIPVTSGRTIHYCKNETPLEKFPVHTFNNLLFSNPVNCSELDFLDLSNMELVEQRVDVVDADPTTIMDLFLDVDHIQTVHLGVYERIGIPKIDNVLWTYFDWGSLQLVKHDDVVKAAWLAVYPGTMIEWQPGAMFITVCTPDSEKTKVSVFKYKDTRYNDKNWQINSDTWEIAFSQDKHQSESIVRFSDINNHLEESKIHFRSWLQENGIN